MLTVRLAQTDVFSQLEMEKFEKWMQVHLRKFFPAQCRAAGKQKLRDVIQIGIERASGYQITSRRDVCKYIDMMVVFGPDFDKDKRLPWVGSILQSGANPAWRMEQLITEGQQHLRLS